MTEAGQHTLTVLHAYEAGEIGWREACKRLNLLSWDELEALLGQHGIAAPPEAPVPQEKLQALADFVAGKGAKP